MLQYSVAAVPTVLRVQVRMRLAPIKLAAGVRACYFNAAAPLRLYGSWFPTGVLTREPLPGISGTC